MHIVFFPIYKHQAIMILHNMSFKVHSFGVFLGHQSKSFTWCPELPSFLVLHYFYKPPHRLLMHNFRDSCFSFCLQIQYNFQWLQAPIQAKKHAKTDKSLRVQPLACMNVSNCWLGSEIGTDSQKHYLQYAQNWYCIVKHILYCM